MLKKNFEEKWKDLEDPDEDDDLPDDDDDLLPPPRLGEAPTW